MNSELTNFASAINIAAGRRNGLVRGSVKLVEASGVKNYEFPRSDFQNWSRSLTRAAKAGLVRTLSDGDCLWIVVPA